jgi:signal peptidase I
MKPKENTGFSRDIAEWAGTIVILVFGTTTIAQPFVVPTGSMETNILVGDHLIVDKLAYAPPGSLSRYMLPYSEVRRGDIITFRYPLDISQTYVKRVIGVPGDRIRILDKQVWINGKSVHEPYKRHTRNETGMYGDTFPGGAPPFLPERGQKMLSENVVNGELIVPDGMYFVLGDNRDDSLDSRFWGFVPRQSITGKPLLIYWSYETTTENLAEYRLEHFMDLAANFFTKTRWSRTFQFIRGYPLIP